MTINPSLYSSSSEHFCTPPEVLEPIYKFVDEIDLDPCSNHGSIVQSIEKYILADGQDGLKLPWSMGTNYINSPYGKKQVKFVDKCIAEYKKYNKVCQNIMLIPARTETKMWQQKIFKTASAVCFWAGRIHFYDPETKKPALCWSKAQQKWISAQAPFPSALIYWGPEAEEFKTIFSPHGRTIILV